uniref:putative nuclease HARBI1 n=1 Tax=Erigeron canadensis TaxID=72917 RepID=UPI001CB8D1F5|nr:putative nuclease HARBI1 [Erigeron canadensis]
MSTSSSSNEIILPPMLPDLSTGSSFLFFKDALAAVEELEDSGSSNDTRAYIERHREEAHEKLMRDYFAKPPKFGERFFRHRYRMSKRLFLKIVGDIEAQYLYFQQHTDSRNRQGFSLIQKCTSAIKQLSTGEPSENFDEYLCMADRTSRECLINFCDAVINIYGREFLRRPTSHDIAMIQQAHEARHHLPGMLGSLDCTHVEWRYCLRSLKRQYTRGDHKVPTIIIEAVASQDLWIWHSFFGPPGSNNDINVLNQSPCMTRWFTFVKAYPHPVDPKEKKFKRVQEAARKDIERVFGVLKGKWKILERRIRFYDLDKIGKVVEACCILHNMIIKDDGRAISPVHIMDQPTPIVYDPSVLPELHDENVHHRLRYDFTEHVSGLDLAYLDDPTFQPTPIEDLI